MLRNIVLLILLSLLQMSPCPGQSVTIYKTTKNQGFHYASMSGEIVTVYKMGYIIDKAGRGPVTIMADTLHRSSGNDFKGRSYSLNVTDGMLILNTNDNRKLKLEMEANTAKVYSEIKHGYFLKSYFDLSDRLNKEFPLNHYTFRTGFYEWEIFDKKTYDLASFIMYIDSQIAMAYDSVWRKQTRYTNTTNFIKENAGRLAYPELRDSLKILPIEYRPQSAYFHQSVYAIAKANPERFYKILEDFPSDKPKVYFAVDDDKALINHLKEVKGYDSLRKEYVKDRRANRMVFPKVIGLYALLAGLVVWLVISNKND